MGLDTYASREPDGIDLDSDDEAAFAGIELCGGIFSGGGGSFRGKVYADAVLEATGESLYQDWIAPERVREMSAALDACDAYAVAEEGRVTPEEVRMLARFFRVCATRGLGLVGSW